ncbi:hypothetical protein ABIA23_005581 [Sinorhizobium fredii]
MRARGHPPGGVPGRELLTFISYSLGTALSMMNFEFQAMRIPRTNFSTAALHDADYADDFEHPHPGAPGDSHVQTTRASAQDHLFEAPEAPRRGADDMGYAGRAARLYGHGSGYAPAQVTASTRDPLPTLAEITGQSDGPSWESHFFLSPNVRFTRTPEREFMKRRAPAADASEAEVDEIALESDEQEAVAEAAPVDAAPPAPETEAPAHSPSELLRVLMQQLPSWRPAQARNAESAADAAPVVVVAPSVAAEPQGVLTPAVGAVEVAPVIPVGLEAAPDPSDIGTGNETNARLSYLSDHAFFEFMPLEIAAAPQVVVERGEATGETAGADRGGAEARRHAEGRNPPAAADGNHLDVPGGRMPAGGDSCRRARCCRGPRRHSRRSPRRSGSAG